MSRRLPHEECVGLDGSPHDEDLCREQQWLLHYLGEEHVQATTCLSEPRSETEWTKVVNMATRHGIAPLLYGTLTSGERSPTVPTGILQALREAFLMNRAKNTLLYQDLAQVLRALQQDSIPVIVLKGAYLATSVYDDIGLRRMNDIDLMVGRTDLEGATARLRELGYTPKHDVQDVATWCMQNRHLPRMFKPPASEIEIHWTIAAPSQFDRILPDDLWDRSQPVVIAGAPARVLSPEDLLLHLCLHTACDSGGPFQLGLGPLCDIAATVQRYYDAISWQQLQARAIEWQTDKCVFLALQLSRDLLAASIPDNVLRALRHKDFEERWTTIAAGHVLMRSTYDPASEVKPVWARYSSLGSHLKCGDLAWILRTAFPSRDKMAAYMAYCHSVEMNPIRNYSCYLTRALDWFRRGASLKWRRIIHGRETDDCARLVREEQQLWQWLNDADPEGQPPHLPAIRSENLHNAAPWGLRKTQPRGQTRHRKRR